MWEGERTKDKQITEKVYLVYFLHGGSSLFKSKVRNVVMYFAVLKTTYGLQL